MQTITPELEAILKSKFQAGASGFRGKVSVNRTADYFPISMDVDHSLQAMASGFTATFTNENGEVGLAADAFPVNGHITAWTWYGSEINEVCVFTGFIDKVAEHRDPRTVTVTCRDWMKVLLVQDIAVADPQGADEEDAVRTTANFVYIDMDVSDIVADLLDKAGYPALQRLIQPTNFIVDEYLGRDGASYADALGELADLVAFNAFADELGVFRFQPDGLVDTPTDTDTPPEPVYIFRSGEDVIALDPERDDYDTKTRVKATGPYTTLQDAWTELWHYNTVKKPTGVRYDPATPTYIYVADGTTRKVYKILQADGTIAASTAALVPTFLNGLSGDPSDATVYWTLETPWATTGSFSGSKVRKHLKSDDSVVDTFTLASGFWTDMKVGSDGIWCTNFATDKIHKLSKTDGSEIASYTITYNAVAQVDPVGVAIDGSDLYMAHYNKARMLVGTVSAPSTITRELKFSGTQSLGGDIDTDTHTELYATAAELSLIYKYTLKEPVTNDVSVEVVNAALEAQLGVELDTGAQIRRLALRLDAVTSFAKATETATRWLDKIDQFRNVLDVGIVGNPAIQKGDMVRIVDPVTEISDDFQVDTYRSSLSGDGTYLGTMALVPWTSSYGGPGTSDLFEVTVNEPLLLAQVGPYANYGTSHVLPIQVTAVDGTLYVFVMNRDGNATNRLDAVWHDRGDPLSDSAPQALTKIAELEYHAANDNWISAWRLVNPDVSVNGASHVWVSNPHGTIDYATAIVLGGVDQANPEDDIVTNSGTGTTSDITLIPGVAGVLLNFGCWRYGINSGSYPMPVAGGAGHEVIVANAQSFAGGGQGRGGSGLGRRSDAPTWYWGRSITWGALGFWVNSA